MRYVNISVFGKSAEEMEAKAAKKAAREEKRAARQAE
jgi:hypothetical protein